jgi:hypothetical protein
LAFAHDIGKVACYQFKDGTVTSFIGGHGERGAALLRRLQSVMELPMEDRDALLLGVEFYHHLSDMPTARWISDRIRSLTALLYVADCDASETEGDKDKHADEARTLYLGVIQPQAPAATTPAPSRTLTYLGLTAVELSRLSPRRAEVASRTRAPGLLGCGTV